MSVYKVRCMFADPTAASRWRGCPGRQPHDVAKPHHRTPVRLLSPDLAAGQVRGDAPGWGKLKSLPPHAPVGAVETHRGASHLQPRVRAASTSARLDEPRGSTRL